MSVYSLLVTLGTVSMGRVGEAIRVCAHAHVFKTWNMELSAYVKRAVLFSIHR